MTVADPAEQLLLDLGITEPEEIDLEVIAHMVEASVRYRPLTDGDARIVGLGDRAVITIDADASPVRQRFSIAHELGHWHHHRGQRLVCRGADVIDTAATVGAEREADRYAASLLMPRFLVGPMIAELPMSMVLVDEVADLFRVSTMAAILRLVDIHSDASPSSSRNPVDVGGSGGRLVSTRNGSSGRRVQLMQVRARPAHAARLTGSVVLISRTGASR